jgi:hypothetical protein
MDGSEVIERKRVEVVFRTFHDNNFTCEDQIAGCDCGEGVCQQNLHAVDGFI